jgi:hypothetical protein
MLINKDPNEIHDVSVSLSGAKAQGLAHVFKYGKQSTAISHERMIVRGSRFTISTQPYSVTTVRLPQVRTTIQRGTLHGLLATLNDTCPPLSVSRVDTTVTIRPFLASTPP